LGVESLAEALGKPEEGLGLGTTKEVAVDLHRMAMEPVQTDFVGDLKMGRMDLLAELVYSQLAVGGQFEIVDLELARTVVAQEQGHIC